MKKSKLSNIAAVSIIGALSFLLWLPLLPLLAPFVVIAVAAKWAGKSSPITTFSQSQAQHTNAWPSLASLPYPAGAGSLPFFPATPNKGQNPKRIRREARQAARVMKGLELRRTALSL